MVYPSDIVNGTFCHITKKSNKNGWGVPEGVTKNYTHSEKELLLKAIGSNGSRIIDPQKWVKFGKNFRVDQGSVPQTK